MARLETMSKSLLYDAIGERVMGNAAGEIAAFRGCGVGRRACAAHLGDNRKFRGARQGF